MEHGPRKNHIILFFFYFKLSTARREDYLDANDLLETHTTKDASYLFPVKFCGHRWLENGKALKRAIEINENLKAFFKDLRENDKIPEKDDRFINSIEKLGSPMHLATLQFSLCITNEIEPFLTFFQAERPLAVFLFEKLKDLVTSLMERFVKSDVLESNSSVNKLLKIDLADTKNLISIDKIKVGSGAQLICNKAKTTQAPDVRKFKQNARDFLVKLIQKLRERSPLKYKFTLYISCLSPTQIAVANTDFLTNQFNRLCLALVEHRWISSTCSDRAESSYKKFIKSNVVLEKMKSFTSDIRLDTLYMELLTSHIELREIVKIVLIISHGNARVEAGFSVNKDALSENMTEDALVAHRIVYDAVQREGGLKKVVISSQMMKSVEKAHSRYTQNLEKNRVQQTEAEKRKLEKRKLTSDLKKVQDAKRKCQEEMKKQTAKLDSEIFNLEEQLRKR